ncbi:MAG: hypothetical protein AAF978_03125 [Cyanobacteria bacterium P01_E01_bin.48]
MSTYAKMLDFAAMPNIKPVEDMFPFEPVNEALAHLCSGNVRYRIVLHQ